MLLLIVALQNLPAASSACEAIWPRPTIAWQSGGERDIQVTSLRDAAQAAPNDGERWLEFGLFLTMTTGEQTKDWQERLEAEQALERAFRLLGGDPRPVAVLAVLRRKQGARIDAQRLIRRALGMVERGNAALEACYEAELYYQMALIYRTWWEDWDGMTSMVGSVGTFKSCPRTVPRREGDPEEIWCPEAFYDVMNRRADLSSMRHDDRDAMIEYLEAAATASPLHRDARRALLLALFEIRNWEGFARALRTGLVADSTDPWTPLWAVTEAYARRDLDRSERFLREALRLLPAPDRAALLSPTRIVPPQMASRWEADYDSVYWRAADPLLLTDGNERLLAHVARVTYAAAKFDAPSIGALGPDTDAGGMLVRYGHPWRRWMIPADWGRELIWAVDSTSPPLRLSRQLTTRRWRFNEVSDAAVRAYAAEAPERWDPREAFEFFDSLPVHVARFEEGVNTVLDVYALWRNPYAEILPDTLRLGFFLNDDAMRPLLDRRRTVSGRPGPIPLQFRVPLAPGFYWYGVETLAGPGRAAGRVRGRLRVADPMADSLRTSDLFLGRAARDAPPTIPHRDSLSLDPLYDLELAPGDSLVVYWETYGLQPDTNGVVRYRVTLDLRDADRGTLGHLVARLGSALGLGRRSGVTLEWDVQAPASDGVLREVLLMDPAGWSPGAHLLRVRIEEPGSGRAVQSERRIRMVEQRETGEARKEP